MEVILFESVRNLGRAGDRVKVADGYYRNYLRPRGMAEEATAGNDKRFEKMKTKALEVAAAKVDEARQIAQKLEGVTVTVKAKAGESDKLFGSVTPGEMAEALKEQGFIVEKRQIITEEPIKHLGEFNITIEVHPEVEAKVKLVVERI